MGRQRLLASLLLLMAQLDVLLCLSDCLRWPQGVAAKLCIRMAGL